MAYFGDSVELLGFIKFKAALKHTQNIQGVYIENPTLKDHFGIEAEEKIVIFSLMEELKGQNPSEFDGALPL